METAYKALQISPHVYWVGAIDWNLRSFHGYRTARGSTYNAYLITGAQNVLIDTVKAPFFGEMRSRIESVLGENPKIDVVISNHAEMDHSGALPQTCEWLHPRRVLATKQGITALKAQLHWEQTVDLAGSEPLRLDGITLRFVPTPMLHWPDSMLSYFEEDRVLFSNDAFGMHLASVERFDDELSPELLKEEAGRYYANILWLQSGLIQKLLATWPSLNIEPALVAPDHGPVWRSQFSQILQYYSQWSDKKPQNKVVITYDSMWGSTEKLAHAIADGARNAPSHPTVQLMSLAKNDRSDVIAALLDAGALVVGSPTLNNQMYPTVAAFLTYLQGLKPKGLVGAAFGSYGWSGEGAKLVEAQLNAIRIPSCAPLLNLRYVPTASGLCEAAQWGATIAEALNAGL